MDESDWDRFTEGGIDLEDLPIGYYLSKDFMNMFIKHVEELNFYAAIPGWSMDPTPIFESFLTTVDLFHEDGGIQGKMDALRSRFNELRVNSWYKKETWDQMADSIANGTDGIVTLSTNTATGGQFELLPWDEAAIKELITNDGWDLVFGVAPDPIYYWQFSLYWSSLYKIIKYVFRYMTLPTTNQDNISIHPALYRGELLEANYSTSLDSSPVNKVPDFLADVANSLTLVDSSRVSDWIIYKYGLNYTKRDRTPAGEPLAKSSYSISRDLQMTEIYHKSKFPLNTRVSSIHGIGETFQEQVRTFHELGEVSLYTDNTRFIGTVNEANFRSDTEQVPPFNDTEVYTPSQAAYEAGTMWTVQEITGVPIVPEEGDTLDDLRCVFSMQDLLDQENYPASANPYVGDFITATNWGNLMEIRFQLTEIPNSSFPSPILD